MGAVSTWAQRLYSRAFAVGDVGAITPFDFMRLPFATAIGFFAFAQTPDVWTIAGGLVIFVASVYAGRAESKRGKEGR